MRPVGSSSCATVRPSGMSGAGTRSLPRTGFAWRSRRRSGSWRTTGTSSPSSTRTGLRAATLSCRRPARGALAGPALPDPAGRHRGTGRVADQGRFGGRGCRRVAPSSSAPVSSAPRSPTGWQRLGRDAGRAVRTRARSCRLRWREPAAPVLARTGRLVHGVGEARTALAGTRGRVRRRSLRPVWCRVVLRRV